MRLETLLDAFERGLQAHRLIQIQQGYGGVQLQRLQIQLAVQALPALLLGRFGATGLEDRVDDVLLGPAGPLLDVLFPPMRADLPTTV